MRVLVTSLVICFAAVGLSSQQGAPKEWRHYLGRADSSSYSTLDEISRSNVGQLELAWTFPAGANNRVRFNPIVVDGVMYVLGKDRAIVALDAATGKQLWAYEHDPLFQRDVTDRGINYWESKDRSAAPSAVFGRRLSAGS